MPLTRDVARNLEPVGKPHACHLAKGRVRLLRRGRIDPGAHAALLRAGFQCWYLVSALRLLPRLADQLVDRRHALWVL